MSNSFLMIPDSVSDRIVLFDPLDGSLIDDNFIDGSVDTGLGIFQTPINRPLAKVFHGMIKSYLFLELATVVKRSLSEIAVRQHSRSETASK